MELLVVISIIALLLSILMPALQAARQQSRKIGCLSNMRQIGLGIELFMASDSDGKFPQQRRPPGTWAPGEREGHWWMTIMRYIAAETEAPGPDSAKGTVGHCPNHTEYKKREGGGGVYCSYRGSWHIMTNAGGGLWSPPEKPISAADVKSPADKLSVYEVHTACTIPYVGDWWSGGWLKLDETVYPPVGTTGLETHGRVSNFLFCDGHVASVDSETLMDPKAHWFPR